MSPTLFDVYGDALPEGALARLGTRRLRHSDVVSGVAIDFDKHEILTTSWDGIITSWDYFDFREVWREEIGCQLYAVARDAVNGSVAVGGLDPAVYLWQGSPRDGCPRMSLKAHDGAIAGLSFSKDGSLLASASSDSTVCVWDVLRGELRAVCAGHAGEVRSVSFCRDGDSIVSASRDGTVRRWDLRGRLLDVFTFGGDVTAVSECGRCFVIGRASDEGHEGFVACIDGTSGSRLWDRPCGGAVSSVATVQGAAESAIAVSTGHRVLLLAATDGELLSELRTTDWVEGVACAPDGETLVSYGHGGIDYWDLRTRTRRLDGVFAGHRSGIVALSASGFGDILSTGYDNRSIVWSLAQGTATAVRSWDVPLASVGRIAPDGRRGVICKNSSSEWRLSVWGIDSASSDSVQLVGHRGLIHDVEWMPNGCSLVSGSADGTVRLWDASHGIEQARFDHEDRVESIAVFSDGDRIGSASAMGVVKVWDVRSKQMERVIEVERGPGRQHLAVSQNGELLGTACRTSTVAIYGTRTGNEVRRIDVGVDVECLTFVGGLIVIGCVDGRIRLYDSSVGALQRVWHGHRGIVSDVLCRQDVVVSCGFDSTIVVWKYPSE